MFVLKIFYVNKAIGTGIKSFLITYITSKHRKIWECSQQIRDIKKLLIFSRGFQRYTIVSTNQRLECLYVKSTNTFEQHEMAVCPERSDECHRGKVLSKVFNQNEVCRHMLLLNGNF